VEGLCELGAGRGIHRGQHEATSIPGDGIDEGSRWFTDIELDNHRHSLREIEDRRERFIG